MYRLFLTYKMHFNPNKKTSLDRYNFKPINVSYETFLKFKGKSHCDRISKRLRKEEAVKNTFIASFLKYHTINIFQIADDISHFIELKNKWESHIANFPYLFRKDCIFLMDSGLTFDSGLGEFVFNHFMKSNIELETFIVMDKLFKFSLDSNVEYCYIYVGRYLQYQRLLQIDLLKYRKILEETVKNIRDIKEN